MTETDERWWSDPELPWWAKLRRAQTLIEQIGYEFREFGQPGLSWRVERSADGDGMWSYRFKVLHVIPADLAALVGDAVHNLRSALDQVTYALAERHAGGELSIDQERASQFPIKETGEDFEKWLTRKNHGIYPTDLFGPDGIEGLRSVQPFALTEEINSYYRDRGEDVEPEPVPPPSEDAAYVLHTLSVIDKHRRLPRLSWYLRVKAFVEDPAYEWDDPAGLREALTDGRLLVRLRYSGKGEPRHEPMLDFDLQLDDHPAADGERGVLATLNWILQSLWGWVIPRLLHVADGNPRPIMIGRQRATGD